MDHDAMLIDVRKLKVFRDDFLVLSKLTPDEFHTIADRVRAGKEPSDAMQEVKGVAKPELKEPGEHPLSEKTEVQDLKAEVAELMEILAPIVEPMTWLRENQGALQGLIVASGAAAHAITDAEGASDASDDKTAPKGPVKDEEEPLGTDKSTGTVERHGEELETFSSDDKIESADELKK